MAMKLRKTLHFAGRKYKDRDGNEKTVWTQCGVALHDPQTGSESIHLEFLPLTIPEGGLWFRLFDPKPKGESAGGGGSRNSGDGFPPDEGDGDVPF